jgi:hypothetical protein
MSDGPTKFETWAVVELFGHQRIAGHCTEETIAGSALLRVDVPAVADAQPFTRYYGAGAIYAITPCTEEVARRVAGAVQVSPIPVYLPRLPQLAAASEQRVDPEFEDEDDDDDKPF